LHGRQIIFSGDLCRRETPCLGRYHQRLHANTRPSQHREGSTARALAIGDMRKGRVIDLLFQGSNFFCHGPENELIERCYDVVYDVLYNSIDCEMFLVKCTRLQFTLVPLVVLWSPGDR
jgi:hypothetical protein